MAFSDFKTISEVQEKYNIKYAYNDFFGVEAKDPSEHFFKELEFSQQHIDFFTSEGSRCEVVIFPILREIYKDYAENYGLWIKKTITYDEILNGTPDYIIATKSELGITVVGMPLIMMVEAKKNDFEQGWGQCLSELVAAQKINDDPSFPVYGIVTDGIMWQFGRLVGNAFTRNRTNFSLDNLPNLFGAVDSVFKAVQEN
ncbi:MAG: hypothetical protein OXM61_00355 [Candidatus Poribacteria bacterium]|nr:hypothetical protein [Candidatus Poribacteria bacterium]